MLQEDDGAAFPFFFSKEDLDDAWRGGSADPAERDAAQAGFSGQAFGGGMSPGQKRRKDAEGEKGIPIGLVRVATLDGVRAIGARTILHSPHPPLRRAAVQSSAPLPPWQLVKQMRSGDVDLRRAVFIGSREAEVAIEGLRVAK